MTQPINTKQLQTATSTILGRVTASTGSAEQLTPTQVTAMLDSFTSALKGLTPASGGGTTNYLRADGTWAAPPGTTFTGGTLTSKLTTVASATGNAGLNLPVGAAPTTPTTGDFWVDSNGVSARFGTATMQLSGNWVDMGQNTLYSTTNPSTPTTGIRLYGIKRANRSMLGWVEPSGDTFRVASWDGANTFFFAAANAGTATISNLGMTMTSVGAMTTAAFATTNYLTMQRRLAQTTATAATLLEQYGQLICARNPGNGGGGFHMSWRFGISALPTDAKLFAGLMSTASPSTNVNPSTLFNLIGLGKDSTDTTALAMFANGSSGTAQKITLTNTGTMTGIANTWWQVELYCKIGDTQFGYRVQRISSAGVVTTDEGVTTGTQGGAGGIPADATAFAPHLLAVATTAVTTTINFGQFYCETD